MLRDVNLQVNKGEFLLITGCSGAGKTTLCRAMFGALHHDIGGDFEGSVTLNGRDIKEYTIGDIGKFMGVVFDDPESQLFMPLVEDEIKFGLQARNMPAGRDDIIKALDRVGIGHLSKRAPHELSGGQKQKVAIAAALSVNPEIILFDEPTSQLDPQSTIEIYEILARLKAEGRTIVLIEQKIEDIIDKVDKIAVDRPGTCHRERRAARCAKEQRALQCHAIPLCVTAGHGAESAGNAPGHGGRPAIPGEGRHRPEAGQWQRPQAG